MSDIFGAAVLVIVAVLLILGLGYLTYGRKQ